MRKLTKFKNKNKKGKCPSERKVSVCRRSIETSYRYCIHPNHFQASYRKRIEKIYVKNNI